MNYAQSEQGVAALENHVLDSRTFIILDFSRTGMQLLSNRSYKVGEKLSLSKISGNHTCSVNVTVAWLRDAAPVDDKLFYIGLTFIDTSHASMRQLEAAFLQKNHDQQKLFLSTGGNGFNRGVRKHERYDVPASILKTPGLKVVNLSEGGMQLRSKVEHRVKKIITLTLKLNQESLVVQSSVVRCEKSASVYESDFNIGVKFERLSTGDTLTIRKFLDGCAYK